MFLKRQQVQNHLDRKSTIYHVKCAYVLKQFQRTSSVKATHCDLIHFPSKGRNRLKFQCSSRKGNKLMVIETFKHFATKSEKFLFYFGTEAVNIRMNNLKKTGSFSGLQRNIIKFIHENILSSLSLSFCGFYYFSFGRTRWCGIEMDIKLNERESGRKRKCRLEIH